MREKTAGINRSINLAQSKINRNYWSPLSCLVKAKEEMMEEIAKSITATMSKSEREKRVLLKMNKKKRWLQI